MFTQSCPTLCGPMNCSPPGSSVHGIFLARILEWIAISFSRGIYLHMYTFYPSIGMKIEIKCSKRELSVLSSSYSCDFLKCSPTLSFPNIQPPPCESQTFTLKTSWVPTLFPSSQRVTMTITVAFCSQIILQKSSTVSSLGPRW